MEKLKFSKTKDGSVGLYNNHINDIYHSSHGALKESIEKFILQSGYINFVKTNKKVSILDICYGIGYNSKSALYLGKMFNKNISIKIDAVEIDKELIFISPFIKDMIPSLDLKIFLVNQISKNNDYNLQNFQKILNKYQSHSKEFFYPLTSLFMNFDRNMGTFMNQVSQNERFLHNIYYQYISNSMKSGLKSSVYSNSSIDYHNEDARVCIQTLDDRYDFIFLDAFTPQKDPTLWTYDFLKLLKSKMHNNSVLITYSNSTPYRAELLNLGFYTGKVLVNEKQFGTVASLNKSNIIYPLDDFDISLTKSKAGIFFTDKYLNCSALDILTKHNTDKNNSDRETSTKIKKKYLNN